MQPAMFFFWVIPALWVLAASDAPTKVQSAHNLLVVIAKAQDATRVQSQLLGDQHTLVLVLAPPPENLVEQITTQLPSDARVVSTELPSKAVEVRITLPDQLGSHVLQKQGRTLKLSMKVRSLNDMLVGNVSRPSPRSVPSTFAGSSFRAAEAALAVGNLEVAERLFGELTNQYSLRSWAELKLADVALVRGDRDAACRMYDAVTERYSRRTSGVLADLRAHITHCAYSDFNWERDLALLNRLEGVVGNFIRHEALWTLSLARTSDEIEHSLILLGSERTLKAVSLVSKFEALRGRSKDLRDTQHVLLARLLRLPGNALSSLHTFLAYEGLLETHPEFENLLLESAEAAFDLGLFSETARLAEALRSRPESKDLAWTWREGTNRALLLLVRAQTHQGLSVDPALLALAESLTGPTKTIEVVLPDQEHLRAVRALRQSLDNIDARVAKAQESILAIAEKTPEQKK